MTIDMTIAIIVGVIVVVVIALATWQVIRIKTANKKTLKAPMPVQIEVAPVRERLFKHMRNLRGRSNLSK